MTALEGRLVVVGTGCGGTEFAFSARNSGWTGPITLIGDDPALPYHRPPLSKACLLGEADPASLCLRAEPAYEKARIELRTGTRVDAIDRSEKRVQLSDGSSLPYDRLILATGGRPRPLPPAEDGASSAHNFHYLRTLADSEVIGSHFAAGRRLVVIGGGYIGLEVAAAAVKSGLRVTVLEAAPRVLARVTAPALSEFYENVHREAGVDVRTSEQVVGFELSADGDLVTAVQCASGVVIPADFVVAGIGLLPNTELASDAGLQVNDGIEVDEKMRTSDPDIFAVGDCARFYSDLYGRRMRLESVPNALEHARKAAACLCGKTPRPDAAPWFWSDQYDLKLKMVGLSDGYDRLVIRGSLQDRSFSAFYLSGNRVLAVDTVNRAAEFNLAKRLVAGRLDVTPDQLEDDGIPLKSLIESAPAMAS